MDTLERIVQLLKEKNKKQKDLTDFLGITKNAFTNWKSGNNTSYIKYLPIIAEFLDVSVDALLGKETQSNLMVQLPDELLELIAQLDLEDRAELKGTVKQMLKSDKYKEKDSASNVG